MHTGCKFGPCIRELPIKVVKREDIDAGRQVKGIKMYRDKGGEQPCESTCSKL